MAARGASVAYPDLLRPDTPGPDRYTSYQANTHSICAMHIRELRNVLGSQEMKGNLYDVKHNVCPDKM